MNYGQKYKTGVQLKKLQKILGKTVFIKNRFNLFGLIGQRLRIEQCPSDPNYQKVTLTCPLGSGSIAASFHKVTGDRLMNDNAAFGNMPLTWERRRPEPGAPRDMLLTENSIVANDVAHRVEHYINLAYQNHVAASNPSPSRQPSLRSSVA